MRNGKKLSWIALVAMGLITAAAPLATRAADDDKKEMVDNPAYKSWEKQKPGTTVTHENSTEFGGQKIKAEMTQTLVEVTPEKAVVEAKMKVSIAGAPEQPAQKQNIPAKVKKSEMYGGKQPEGSKSKATEKGKEKIEVLGKKYECKVVELEGEHQGAKVTGKMWTSEEIPGGLAKMETETTNPAGGAPIKTTMTLTKLEKK